MDAPPGIDRRVTMHTVRHSIATHLLEDGTDLSYVRELLGHSRPETMMIYTHVTLRRTSHGSGRRWTTSWRGSRGAGRWRHHGR